MNDPKDVAELNPIARLTRDLARGAALLSDKEARYLVDTYYIMQEQRLRASNQVRALADSLEPNTTLGFFLDQFESLEGQVKKALDVYSREQPLGAWARSQKGIGPVLAAGLLAHIDITKAPTAGHIWRYAGLDPTQKWEKGQKRPWNAALKLICWKIGESFVKVSGNEDAFYGRLYAEYKQKIAAKNDAGENAEAAAQILATKKIGRDTETYKHLTAGRLPPAQIHARAKRWAVKLFLAHYHEQGYRLVLKKEPPLPYPIAHLNHVHKIEAPNPVALEEA